MQSEQNKTITDKALADYIHIFAYGRSMAIASAVLRKQLGVSGNEVRRRVHRLRRNGVPICSCKSGYYYAANAGDVVRTIRELEKLEAGIRIAKQGLVNALDEFTTEGR